MSHLLMRESVCTPPAPHRATTDQTALQQKAPQIYFDQSVEAQLARHGIDWEHFDGVRHSNLKDQFDAMGVVILDLHGLGEEVLASSG
eukprot:39994-Eustigmatos_ZCMA.PRE.1